MKKLINFLVLNLFVFIFTFITRPTMAVTLPDGYTELEYIESTGTQYIDTGILANDGTGYKITLNLPDVQTDSNQFGTRNDNGNTRFSWGVSDGKAYAGWGSNYPTYDSRPAISANVFNTASVNYLNDRTYKLNNTTAYSGLPTLEFTVANNFYLFALINAGTLYYKSYKIKEAIFTQGSSVTKHLIPAQRNSDNVIGMYDTVSGTFFENKGTGAFVAGPVLDPCRNLFNKDAWLAGVQENKYRNNSGEVTDISGANYSIYTIAVEPNTQYVWQGNKMNGTTINGGVYFLDGNKSWISRITGLTNAANTFTTPANCRYLQLQIGANGQNFNFTNMQLEKGSTATPYVPYDPQCATCDGTVVNYTSATGTVTQNGTPTPTNPIYPTFYTQGDMVLRKVGDYADTYDATTGKITRRVGVKVLDGVTAGAKIGTAWNTTYKRGSFAVSDMKSTAADVSDALSSHFEYSQDVYGAPTVFGFGTNNGTIFISFLGLDNVASADTANAWLAEQYAAGTPVTIYYPLATETTEDWTGGTSYCQQAIKIASTKYVETEFSALNTALANAVATVNTVVTQTIAQAASIATLQSGKQTRPADNTECPAYKQCLLVEDEQGTPHWYEIFDPINRWLEKIQVTLTANNVNYTYFGNTTGAFGKWTSDTDTNGRWQGNGVWRSRYIDGSSSTYSPHGWSGTPARTVGGMYQTLTQGEETNAGTWAMEYESDDMEGGMTPGVVYGIAKCTSVAGSRAYNTTDPRGASKFSELSAADQAKWAELPALHGQPEREGYDSESFKQCWCKMTAVGVPGEDGTAANGSVYPVNPSSSAWVFSYTFSSGANCANRCANGCASNVRSDASFRSAVFGM